MANKGSDLSFLNGVPELLILQLLARREMYGYEVVRAIAQSTGQVLEFGEGCIYPILHTMEKRKWLASRRMTSDGRERIYYRLTEKGQGRLKDAASRWSEISSAIELVLGAKHAGHVGR